MTRPLANFKDDLLAAAAGEPILALVIGEMGWGDYASAGVPGYAEQPRGVVLTWEDAAPWLDYAYDTGHGAPRCNAVYAWTATRVLFVSQYDGATEVEAIPRNPTPCAPEMPGG